MPNEAAAEAWLSKYAGCFGIRSKGKLARRVRNVCEILFAGRARKRRQLDQRRPMRAGVKVICNGGGWVGFWVGGGSKKREVTRLRRGNRAIDHLELACKPRRQKSSCH